MHLSQFNKLIDQTQAENLTSFYVEILAKPAVRQSSSFNEDADLEDDFDMEDED